MTQIPIYSICNVNDIHQQDIVVVNLQEYLKEHPSLVFPHRHSFYQILYITQSGGDQTIDSETYDAAKGTCFFVAPGQMHEWRFNEKTDGILINMNTAFFGTFLTDARYLDDLIFFSNGSKHPAVSFAEDDNVVDDIFKKLLTEYTVSTENNVNMLRALLLQLFVLAERKTNHRPARKNAGHFKQFEIFEKLVEQHYTQKKLPKEYAEMLFITPNYLNALCTKHTGRSAGELIRSRILLEAKKLLAHSHLSVNEIAYQLNFESNSYFCRFFKKYESVSPDEFRKTKKQNPALLSAPSLQLKNNK